jgi:hypothetical protein
LADEQPEGFETSPERRADPNEVLPNQPNEVLPNAPDVDAPGVYLADIEAAVRRPDSLVDIDAAILLLIRNGYTVKKPDIDANITLLRSMGFTVTPPSA